MRLFLLCALCSSIDARAADLSFAGQYSLKSHDGRYLRVWYPGEILALDSVGTCWIIQDNGGKIVLDMNCFGQNARGHLRARSNGSLAISEIANGEEIWTPFKNNDGSWSFRSEYGTWLNLFPSWNAKHEVQRSIKDHIWLEPWEGIPLESRGICTPTEVMSEEEAARFLLHLHLLIGTLLTFVNTCVFIIYCKIGVRRKSRRPLPNKLLSLDPAEARNHYEIFDDLLLSPYEAAVDPPYDVELRQ